MTKLQQQCNKKQPLAIIISGPSGVGKDAVIQRMKQLNKPYNYIVTATSRPLRPNEVDGLDYVFLSVKEFRQKIQNSDFLEWAKVYNHYYGTPKKAIADSLNAGKDTIIKTDVQGAKSIKKLLSQGLFIFIMPPSEEELARRINMRKTETSKEIDLRLATAKREVKEATIFDHTVVNDTDQIDKCMNTIEQIIYKEKLSDRIL
jgi:guanylate kinase